MSSSPPTLLIGLTWGGGGIRHTLPVNNMVNGRNHPLNFIDVIYIIIVNICLRYEKLNLNNITGI